MQLVQPLVDLLKLLTEALHIGIVLPNPPLAIKPPPHGERHNNGQPEQIADGEAQAH
jgi:hypothetical protein